MASVAAMNRPPPPPPKTDGVARARPPPPPPPTAPRNFNAGRPPPPPPPPPPSGKRNPALLPVHAKPRPPPPPSMNVEGGTTNNVNTTGMGEFGVAAVSAGSITGVASVGGTKKRSIDDALPPLTRQQLQRRPSFKAPAVMRDVTAFQKRHQVGEGTYGSVFVGADKVTGEIVALKRINTEAEENGFPITAIREVKILKALNHENIVTLKEIVTSKDSGDVPKNVFLAFEYLEYDLTGVIETKEIKITQDHIKSWSNQLLKGVHFMHINKIIHRDLKASNLLINRRGELKIADWGLARSWNPEMNRLTNRVITLWYRPPELLLGCTKYSTKIDMWSVGCIIAEMFKRGGLLKGTNELHQLDLIFRMMGHPTTTEWPDIHTMCPLWKNFEPTAASIGGGGGETGLLPRTLRDELKNRVPTVAIPWMTPHSLDVIDNLLTHNPETRWSAAQALTAEWFFDAPMVKSANKLNMNFGVDSAHEWEAKKKYKEMLAKRALSAAK